jgi:hypothetical protein
MTRILRRIWSFFSFLVELLMVTLCWLFAVALLIGIFAGTLEFAGVPMPLPAMLALSVFGVTCFLTLPLWATFALKFTSPAKVVRRDPLTHRAIVIQPDSPVGPLCRTILRITTRVLTPLIRRARKMGRGMLVGAGTILLCIAVFVSIVAMIFWPHRIHARPGFPGCFLGPGRRRKLSYLLHFSQSRSNLPFPDPSDY